MNNIKRTENRANEGDLQRVIEPLASYLCAAERPGAILKLVLAALVREVEQTNSAAHARVAALLESRIALPA